MAIFYYRMGTETVGLFLYISALLAVRDETWMELEWGDFAGVGETVFLSFHKNNFIIRNYVTILLYFPSLAGHIIGGICYENR